MAAEGPEEWAERAAQYRAEALENFPYERIEVPGGEALSEWERLSSAGGGSPVVIGSDEDFDRILEPYHPSWSPNEAPPDVEDVLARARELSHPASLDALAAERAAQFEAFLEQNSEQGNLDWVLPSASDDVEPVLGEWPDQPLPPMGTLLTVATNLMTGEHHERVAIVVLPTDDPTEIPAYMRWGGWNDCPPAEYHVAALKSWRDRYGAELIGLSGDVMNIRVSGRPQTRDEALALAREQYAYCADIVDQGVGTLRTQAAVLMANDWWYFWWD